MCIRDSILSIIIWAIVFNTYGRLPAEGSIVGHTVPWYDWANRLGVTGLLAIFGFVYLLSTRRNLLQYAPLILLVLVSLLIGRFFHKYNYYMEDRVTFFIMIPCTIMASYVVIKIFYFLKNRLNGFRYILLGFFLLLIIIPGFLPYLLVNESVDLGYWLAEHGSNSKLTNSEIDSFNFLRLNTPPNCSVLTLTLRSQRLLSYAGLSRLQVYVNRDPSIVLSPRSFAALLYSLRETQLGYIFMTSEDEAILNRSYYAGFLGGHLLEYLPVAFRNDKVTIYKLPVFSPPSDSSKIAFVLRRTLNWNDIFSLSALALSKVNYSIVLDNDPLKWRFSTLILVYDKELNENNINDYLKWVSVGGHLIVIDASNSSTEFGSLFPSSLQGMTKADGILGQKGSITFPIALEVPIFNFNATRMKFLANYTLDNKSVAPYAITEDFGRGSITYLIMSPYFLALKGASNGEKKDLFVNIGSLIEVLDFLNRTLERWDIYFPQFDYLKLPINFTGKVIITTNSLLFSLSKIDKIMLLNEINSINASTSNFTIYNVKYNGGVKFKIECPAAFLKEESLPFYSRIEVRGPFNLTVEVPREAYLKLVINNYTKDITNTNITFIVVDNRSEIITRTPAIDVYGRAYFYRARIFRNHYKMPLFYDDGTKPFEVKGRTSFNIIHSDNGIIFIRNFSLAGNWSYPEQTKPSLTEMDIPWSRVLLSPCHLLLLLACFYFLLRLSGIKIRVKIYIRKLQKL